MDLLQSYSDPDGGASSSPESSPLRILPTKSAAPKVDDTMLAGSQAQPKPLDPTQHVVNFNPTYDQLWAPIYGPAHPFAKDGLAQGLRNHKLGFVEDASIQPFVFDEQYNTFQKFGYAADPSATYYIGDLDAVDKNGAVSVYNIPKNEQKRRKLEKKKEKLASLGEDEGDGGNVDGDAVENPASEVWLAKNSKSPWSGKREGIESELTDEQKKYAEEHARKQAEKEGGHEREKGEMVLEKSTFHGKEEKDYQGRSWIAPPKDAKASNDHCYIPKRLVHTWSGHTKGVSAIRFFPKHGHLILSAGMDSKVKIWDVFNSGKCMRTYMGHSKAVRDISFSNDGTKFLTASYDRNIKYWDTETGKVISTFSTGKIPYVVRLNPDDDKQNILLAGMSDKKIVQWDMNSGQITQEYDQHLGAVNTITFVDDNRRFVTSSDDKSLRVWEFGIPVVIKYISEPHMHSMPAISMHPNGNWLAAQSLDNQILIYGTRDRFQLNKKKRFAGHIVAGYACQVNFSPDGRFVMSGDGEGKCWFWDWKSCKVFRTLKCHDGVCIGAEWHPLEQSKVATCGWDGLIKYCSYSFIYQLLYPTKASSSFGTKLWTTGMCRPVHSGLSYCNLQMTRGFSRLNFLESSKRPLSDDGTLTKVEQPSTREVVVLSCCSYGTLVEECNF
ncbi:RNA splicing factor [Lithospermum erythrorhizon]|uniref:Pre-mRNA-processing factor 17 n=1 Tax=Lithospermum erythrorhizon TaxID=34254 RepID=A0AAV3Q6D2_LITER